MKLFAFFMAFHILALSIMPCNDVHNDCSSFKTKSQITQNENHNHKSDHNDLCSPFCSCDCCQTVMVINFTNTSIKIKNLFIESDVKIANHNFYGNIWQPPKI